MDTLMIKIQPDKKDFFLALLKEFSFVVVEESFTTEEEKYYIEAIEESEEDIKQGRGIAHEDQRRNYIPLTKPNRPDYNKPKFSKEDAMKWWDEESQEPELDANLTDKELLEMIKDI